MHINVLRHGALGIDVVALAEVAVTNDIPKRYFSATNGIPKA